MERYKRHDIEIYVSHFQETKVSPISNTQSSKKTAIEPKQLDNKKVKKNIKGSKSFDDYLDDAMIEDITIPIESGDEILTGKFKNHRVIVDHFDTDEKGQPTIVTDTGKEMGLLKVRVPKLMK